MMLRPGVAFLVLAVALAAAACDKQPVAGDPCKKTDIRCVDPKTELACQKGVFVAAPCKGPLGCQETNKVLTCDISGNADGDPCSTDDEGNSRCVGENQRITCLGGKYAVDFCRGDEGCKVVSSTVKCDQSKAADGDPCRNQTNACGVDAKSVLSCVQGRFRPSAQCPGEGGCAIADREVTCDLGKKDDARKR